MPSSYEAGATYDRISAPLERLGVEVLDRLELTGDETVLDAGCGSGRVTQALVDRLPRGHVIALDGSPAMLAAAGVRFAGSAELLLQDLEELNLGGRRVDAVLSTSTLHWIADHTDLFARLRSVLRDGGRLVAQCGGRGNTPELVAATQEVAGREPFGPHLEGWSGPWNYAAPEDTAARLAAAGFERVRTWLVRRPAPYEQLREWLKVNALSAHLARLPGELREPYLDAVEDALGADPQTTYIRLNIDATASSGPELLGQ